MTSQAAAANFSKNTIGDGGHISINVTTTSKKNGKEKSESAATFINLNNEDHDTTLVEWLKKLRLDKIFTKLQDLGVEDVEDALLLDEEDLQSLDLKKIEMKKLMRAIAKLEQNN